MDTRTLQVILFDLGGVLVRIDGERRMLEWTRNTLSRSELWQVWLESSAVQRFETGQLSPEAFAEEMVTTFKISATSEEFLREFEQWAATLYPRAKDVLNRVRQRFHTACLSNTNALHWNALKENTGINQYFDSLFLSHEIRAIKPDPQVFDYVVNRLNVPAASILFLDDNPENLRAAENKGIHTLYVQDAEQLEQMLERKILLQ